MGGSFGASSLRRALVGLVALKVAGLILVFDHDGIVAFDLPKSLFSRALEWLIAGALVIAILRFGPGIVPRARLHVAVAALILANLLSMAFAANRYLALFGEQDRYLGLAYLADMVVLYLACAVAVRSIREWAVVGTAIAIASALTLAYAGLQYAGLDPLSWQEDPRGRPFGTFGNPDQFGHFLAAGFGAALGLAIGAQRVWRWIGGAAAGAFLVAAAVVATRATLLGDGAVVAAAPLLALRAIRPTAGTPARAALGSLAAVVLLVALLAPTPLGQRALAKLPDIGSEDRVLLYEAALRSVADRPLLGFGPDNFGVAFARHRSPRSVATLGAGPQTSAHDWLLDVAATTGLAGLAASLVLVGMASVAAWRGVVRSKPAVGAALLLAWIGYFGAALVDVGSVSVGWVPWVVLGGVAGSAPEASGGRPVASRGRAMIALAIAAIALAGALSGARAFLANRDAWEAESARAVQEWDVAIDAASAAVARDADRADHWNLLGLALDGRSLWRDSGDAFAEAALRSPHQVTYWANLARSRARQALAGDDSRGGATGALAAADEAVASDPANPIGHTVRVEIALALRRCDIASRAAADALALAPGDATYTQLAARASACSPSGR